MKVVIKLLDGQLLDLDFKCLCVYDRNGIPIVASEQLNETQHRSAILAPPMQEQDPDLEDIILSNGLPCKPIEDISHKFSKLGNSRVFKVT
jgi:hypothetical protein